MMKRILMKLGIFAMGVLVSVCGLMGFKGLNSSKASAYQNVSSIEAYSAASDIETYLAEFVKFDSRLAGSKGEEEASEYIFNTLSEVSGLSPVKNKNAKQDAGKQIFSFKSTFDGKSYYSQNIIFEHKSEKENAKKVVIGTSYDSLSVNEKGEVIKSEAVNGSAGSVASLLTLAKNLSASSFDFDIEFVFFGAGESKNAGSEFYTNGISSKESENILLMINLDNVALGNSLYFYVDEIKNDFSEFAAGLSEERNLGVQEVKISHLAKNLLDEPGKLGLTYSHIANTSDNENFMKLGVLSLNIFAGSYDSGVITGVNEYEGKTSVIHTKDDNLEYIGKTYGKDVVSKNLTAAFDFIKETITDKNFVASCEGGAKTISSFYAAVTNQKLITYLTIVAFFVSIIVALLIYYKLSVKAYNANVESEFGVTVLKISENFDNINPGNDLPKIVGQVVANDIKKDKRIKRKKDKQK